MKPTLTLSTCWCSHRHKDGYEMLREIADLGFKHVELSHGTRITLVPGILKAIEEGMVKVSSTHNFCPLPTGVNQAAPNLFEPSALDEREHTQWVRHTKRSIDFAAQIDASVVVCHLGSVPFGWFNPGATLRNFPRRFPKATLPEDKRYQKLLTRSSARLRKRMGPYWERTKASVNEMLGYAAEKKVKLGLENREKFEELPVDDDYSAFFESLPADASVGYWHDTGHAQIKEQMGLINQRAQLEKLAPKLIGFHLHDVNAQNRDHQPIGAGSVDFAMISQFWRPEHLLVLEFSPRLTVAEVTHSKERIEALM